MIRVKFVRSKFHNLEDKVAFNGDGIVMKPKRSDVLEAAYESGKQVEGHIMCMRKVLLAITRIRVVTSHMPHGIWKECVKK